MKRFKQMIFATVIAGMAFGCGMATANEYDFFETITIEDESLIESAIAEQEANAKKFSETLGECKELDYAVEKSVNTIILDEYIVETNDEKLTEVSKYEGLGYVVTSLQKEDVVTNDSYEFSTLNGKVTGAIINGVETDEYNGQDITTVLANFTSYSNDDLKVEVSDIIVITNPINVVDVKESTKEDAIAEVERLKELGYDASYKQNNTNEVTEENVTYTDEKTEEEIISEIEEKNEGKEVLNIEISDATEVIKDKYTSEKYEEFSDASNKKAELEESYDNVSDVKSEEVVDTNKDNAELVQSEVAVSEEVDFELPYVMEIEGGYRRYYSKNVLISSTPADSFEENFLTEAECKSLKSTYDALGYTTTCTAVTTTTLEKTENKYEFNDEIQDEAMEWEHLDISVEQEIVLYNEDGTVKERVTATVTESPKGWVNKGTDEERAITYNKNKTSDGGRYEYRSRSDSSFSYDDVITLEIKVRYTTKDGVTHNETLILEGYLKNIFNVCRQKDSERNRGFDVEIIITVDSDGNEVVNFVTSTVWTFTASREEKNEYGDRVFYDEYKYGTKELYYVEANNIDYSYDVSYLATDYTVSYTGSEATYSFDVFTTDFDYVITGTKNTYTITTKGEIIEKDMCGVGDEEFEDSNDSEEPPHTDACVNNTDLFVINNVAILEDKKRRVRKNSKK